MTLYSLMNAFKKTEEEFITRNILIEKEDFSDRSDLDLELLKKNDFILKSKLKTLRSDFLRFAVFINDYYNLKNLHKNKNKMLRIANYYKSYYFQKTINFGKKKQYIYNNYSILIINTTKKKPIINVINKDKLILNLTPGIIKKKLEIKEKNVKKSYKMLKMMMKISSFNIKKIFEIKNFIIQLKGSKSKIPQILTLLKRYLSPRKKIFIFTPKITNNRIKFKKIKAIKRRLKKKFIKM